MYIMYFSEGDIPQQRLRGQCNATKHLLLLLYCLLKEVKRGKKGLGGFFWGKVSIKDSVSSSGGHCVKLLVLV